MDKMKEDLLELTKSKVIDSEEEFKEYKQIDEEMKFFCKEASFYKNNLNSNKIFISIEYENQKKKILNTIKIKSEEFNDIKTNIINTELSNIKLKAELVKSIEKIEKLEDIANGNNNDNTEAIDFGSLNLKPYESRSNNVRNQR